MDTPTAAPLSHHAILALVAPFSAAGWALDLPASDRAARRLVFRPAAHAAGATHPALTETRELRDTPRGWQLLRLLQTEPGGAPAAGMSTQMTAEVVAEDGEPAELLAAAAAIAPGDLFTAEGASLVLRCRPGHPPQLRAAQAQVAGLRVACTVSGVKGYPMQLVLTRAEGDIRRLPDDLFEVLGSAWSRLVPLRTGWEGAHRKFKRPPKPDDQTAASQDGTSAAVRSWLRRPFGPSRRFPWGSSGLDLRSRS